MTSERVHVTTRSGQSTPLPLWFDPLYIRQVVLRAALEGKRTT